MISNTIGPWLLGIFVLLSLIVITLMIKAWRDMKRSPYFFLRRQAEKQFQSYAAKSVVLLLVTAVLSFYTLHQPEPDTTVRVAILSNTKPPKAETIQLFAQNVAADEVNFANLILSGTDSSLFDPVTGLSLVSDERGALAVTALPDQYDRVRPLVDLQDDTELGQIFFSTEVDSNFEAIEPRFIFAEGRYRLYATFSYEGMADGMAWSWVWRHNGEVVEGNNELWQYGPDGPGYIFYGPETGFQNGEYSLEVWVNGELMTQATAIMNTTAVTAGN
ncbi:MAG: hypothetical protein R6X32_09255 [Chloroflexota bacterium]